MTLRVGLRSIEDNLEAVDIELTDRESGRNSQSDKLTPATGVHN